jgi:hypothetical protein
MSNETRCFQCDASLPPSWARMSPPAWCPPCFEAKAGFAIPVPPPPTPALTLTEVEAIATRAAHEVNPAIRVIVDNAKETPRAVVWLSLAGQQRACEVYLANHEADVLRVTHLVIAGAARFLCEAVGKAWRPEGWREP